MPDLRSQVREAVAGYGAQLDVVPTIDGITDAVMAVIDAAPSCPHIETSDDGTSWCRLAAAAPQPAGPYRVGRSLGRTIYRGDDLIGMMDTPELAAMVVAALNRSAPQPKVLWRGDLNDLLHAVNGTPILSLLLDAAVAPDDPDAHKIRVAVIEDTGTSCCTCPGSPIGPDWLLCCPVHGEVEIPQVIEDTETPT